MRLVYALIAALVAVPAAAAVPPEAKDCLNSRNVRNQRIVDERTIYFREGSRWYRNDLGSVCPGLRSSNSFSTRSSTAQLCAGDLITVFDARTSVTYGSCALSRFTAAEPPQATRR